VFEDVADTALWVAAYRARESSRPDALFRDPLAARLAGDRGEELAHEVDGSASFAWSIIVRTCVLDDLLREAIAAGADTVVNLGAGMDTRPYRMDLPQALRWVEVDAPKIIELKEQRLPPDGPPR
jgi:methyltransferase (TIGR00027 family)